MKIKTVSDWEEKIVKALLGEVENAIINVGTIEEYFIIELKKSNDFYSNKILFKEALSNVIQDWQYSDNKDPVYTYYLLGLISEFKPKYALDKIILFLRYWKDYDLIKNDELYNINSYDIIKKSLQILHLYYPLPPYDSINDLGFQSYLALLESFMDDISFIGLAFGRLLRLNNLGNYDKLGKLFFSKKISLNNIKELIWVLIEEPVIGNLEEFLFGVYDLAFHEAKDSLFLKALNEIDNNLARKIEGKFKYIEEGKNNDIMKLLKSGSRSGFKKVKKFLEENVN